MEYRFNCDSCGKEIIRSNQRAKKHYCSLECRWDDVDYRKKMKLVAKRVNENPTEKQLASRFQKGHTLNNGKHRSPETEFVKGEEHPGWKGGTEKSRGSNWRTERQLALERDSFTCQRCGEVEDLIVHHITPYKETQDNSLDNLITFCRRCHVIHENKYSKTINTKDGFLIFHVPEKKLKWFDEFAKNEFLGNRGMALASLIDFYIGLIPSGIEHVEEALNDLEDRVGKLENKPKEDPKERKTLDGKRIGGKKQ